VPKVKVRVVRENEGRASLGDYDILRGTKGAMPGEYLAKMCKVVLTPSCIS
jgi:hypothetical protein